MLISVHGRAHESRRVSELTAMLAKALFESGFYVLSFSSGGRGSVLFDKAPVASRSLGESDFLLCLSMPDIPSAAKATKQGGAVIANSQEKVKSPALKRKKVRLYAVDAAAIGSASLANTPSPALAGALAKIFAKLTLKSVKAAARRDAEAKAAEEGYKAVK